MIVYFDLQPEYRQRLAALLGSSVEELKAFFSDVEDEIAWYLAFGGLKESDLGEDEIRSHIRSIHDSAVAVQRELGRMPRDVYGWLAEHAPLGTNYKQPFEDINEPLARIIDMTSGSLKQEAEEDPEQALRSDSVQLIRKLAHVCTTHFERKPDIESGLFRELVGIVFDALGVREIRDVDALVKQANAPRFPKGGIPEEDTDLARKRKILPRNYAKATRRD